MAEARRVIVYVHGICEHDDGYSDPWFAALAPHLPSGYEHAEVIWSDVVRSVRGVVGNLTRSSIEYDAAQVKAVVEDRARQQAVESKVRPAVTAMQAFQMKPGWMLPGVPERGTQDFLGVPGMGCFDDCGVYLSDRDKRLECRVRFAQVVAPLLEAGDEVTVISHSWGTVVAMEALSMEVDYVRKASDVKTWFTVGAALSIGYVKRQLDMGNATKPRCVRKWVNVNAHYDVVGGSLSGMYDVDREYLGLTPIGCIPHIPDPRCAHASYWRPDNVPVNRDVFAAEIL